MVNYTGKIGWMSKSFVRFLYEIEDDSTSITVSEKEDQN